MFESLAMRIFSVVFLAFLWRFRWLLLFLVKWRRCFWQSSSSHQPLWIWFHTAHLFYSTSTAFLSELRIYCIFVVPKKLFLSCDFIPLSLTHDLFTSMSRPPLPLHSLSRVTVTLACHLLIQLRQTLGEFVLMQQISLQTYKHGRIVTT